MDIIRVLQTQVAPTIFTPRAVYDGRKNMFAARELPFGDTKQQEVGTPSIRFDNVTEVSIVRGQSVRTDCQSSTKGLQG